MAWGLSCPFALREIEGPPQPVIPAPVDYGMAWGLSCPFALRLSKGPPWAWDPRSSTLESPPFALREIEGPHLPYPSFRA